MAVLLPAPILWLAPRLWSWVRLPSAPLLLTHWHPDRGEDGLLDLDHASGREVAARRSWDEASRRSVVICSHFAIDGRGKPPRSLTWVGASRSTLDTGTTITSFASRLRMSGDTTSAVTLALVAIAGVVVMNLKAITRGVKLTAASRACVAGEHR